ncbi:ead/Ea22-like family protein [Salmonella enterica subsp. salamae]|uniref:ead/Ea22-like family protein n=1 Tax=Salmonella enterica TaxID=28901 RepID=UPI001E56D0E4|nr:ead/Ea22-like family protein [Salmonella enterica]
MNVFEMEGFLRGKCIPRDLKVNETNAEYLVRKFIEAEERCAALSAKLSMINDLTEAAEQANKLAQEATEKLVQERNALAAENHTARNAVQTFCDVVGANTDAICEEVGQDGVKVILAAMSATGNMPATDAFLAEVRAQGVEMFADKYRAQLTALPTNPENIFDAAHVSLRYQIFDADEFAAQLRKGVAQ